MRELSLFTGAGGGLLGTLLLGWRPIGYVEIDDYCQRVIAQRISDGILPAAPIFTDVREFVQSGAARQYRGFTDVVTAGFPCQPFSTAGRRRGADDPRNMWPATIDTIRAVRPRFAFLENVPGLVTSGYFGTVLGDLAESGYDARWRILSAAEVGAPHKRDRLWIVAYRNSIQRSAGGMEQNAGANGRHNAGGMGEDVSDACGSRCHRPYTVHPGGDKQRNHTPSQQGGWAKPRQFEPSGEDVAGTDGTRPSQSRPNGGAAQQSRAKPCSNERGWWATEPDVGRVAHGVAARVERLKAIGNGQVPLVVATAWRLLTEDLEQ